jgi:hypothetical protein
MWHALIGRVEARAFGLQWMRLDRNIWLRTPSPTSTVPPTTTFRRVAV